MPRHNGRKSFMSKANRDQHCRKRNCRGARLMSKLFCLTSESNGGIPLFLAPPKNVMRMVTYINKE